MSENGNDEDDSTHYFNATERMRERAELAEAERDVAFDYVRRLIEDLAQLVGVGHTESSGAARPNEIVVRDIMDAIEAAHARAARTERLLDDAILRGYLPELGDG